MASHPRPNRKNLRHFWLDGRQVPYAFFYHHHLICFLLKHQRNLFFVFFFFSVATFYISLIWITYYPFSFHDRRPMFRHLAALILAAVVLAASTSSGVVDGRPVHTGPYHVVIRTAAKPSRRLIGLGGNAAICQEV
jgi:hypothetical protein